jgi:hypothetical protein
MILSERTIAPRSVEGAAPSAVEGRKRVSRKRVRRVGGRLSLALS